MTILHESSVRISPARSGGRDFVLKLDDGAEIGFATYGDSNGKPLLFYHGWPGSRLQGEMAHAAALAQGWCLIAPDRPGIGLTRCPDPFTLHDWPRRIGQLMDALGWEKCHLLAISGGTPTALASACLMPERFHAVGICCGAACLHEASSVNGLFPLFRMLLKLDQTIPLISPGVLRLMQAYLKIIPGGAGLQPQRLLLRGADRKLFADGKTRRLIADSLRAAYAQGPHGILADGRAIAAPWLFDWRKAPAQVPFAFWHGDDDGTIPLALAQWSVREMGCSDRLRILPGEGHFSLPIGRAAEILEELEQAGAGN